MSSFNTGFDDLNEYLEFLKIRGRRESTLHNYEVNLSMLLRTLKEGGRNHTAETIDDEDLLWLNNELGDVSERSRKSYIRLVSLFVMHFTGIDQGKKMGVLYNDDGGTHVYFITIEDFAELYKAGDEVDRLILVLGAFMGLRRMEIAGIREKDIEGNTMIIHGKGHGPQGKVSRVDIPPRVMQEIESFREWKREYRFGFEGEFLLESGQRHRRLSRMTPATIGRRMSKLKGITGIEFSPHSLRRLFATTMYYETGADIMTIKNLLRHSKYETTVARYIAPMRRLEKEAAVKVSAVYERALGEL